METGFEREIFGDDGLVEHVPKSTVCPASREGVQLEVVKLAEAKRGFMLLPRRWVVERSFGWLARFRRLARVYEQLPQVLGGLHFLVFIVLMLPAATRILATAASS